MTAAMGETSGLVSENEGRGLSDETESEMWANRYGNGVEVGETIVDLEDDLRELGLGS